MSCDCPVDQIFILPYISGGTIISWSFRKGLSFSSSDSIEIQVSRHDTADNTAWSVVGTVPIENTQYVDAARRSFGSQERVYYRLRVLPYNCYTVSKPIMAGITDCRVRGDVREIIRREKARHRSGETQRGVLLKRKYSGVRCNVCSDPDYPDRLINSDCLTCFRTGYVGGYFLTPNFFADLNQYGSAGQRGENLDIEGADSTTILQYLNIPDVQVGDVWVDVQSDQRWLVDQIKTIARVGSYTLVAAAAVTKLNTDDIVYKVTVPLDMRR